jgi:acyl-CoA hydrolase
VKRLVDALAPGMRAFVPGIGNESAVLAEELRADPERAAGVTFCAVQYPGIDPFDYLALHPQARLESCFMTPALRRGLVDGRATLLPFDYLAMARHLIEGTSFDVAIAHIAPPDADGWCSSGLSADLLPLVWPRARRRVAHFNPRQPRTRGSFRVHVSEVDVAVERDTPLLPYADPRAGEVESRIGVQVAALVRDGDTLQFGIGSVPLAVAGALVSHRRLRLHGGLASAALRVLWDAGALDRDARITTGVLLGDAALHEFAACLEPLWLTDVTHTHASDAILAATRGTRFVAVNSAVEVDLLGQVNAERANGAILAGAGGLPAFAQAALAAPGGRLLTCLASTAKGGSVSRIVPALGDSAACTLPRHLADVVITEHGGAELRELGLDARAEALIGVAAPAHRAALAEAWSRIRVKL